ncbi:MAG TPA: matrixin family metalloprotease, partial [Gemmataceae bacterium]|nr:matrixin family metalloprotease [Gemmataceae bacterium]
MSTRSRLRLEALDDRLVPATFGTPWPLGNLTVSFAPDGTNVDVSAGASQPLPGVPADVWQREVLRAFQTWAVSANLNIGLVADGGQPFGTPGAPQGDARFGDVRVAAVPMDPAGAVALGTPFDLNAGTRSGDVWFNSAVTFGAGGSPGYDVFSVALHEAGHVLGVGENEDPTSAMFDQAVTHVGLSPADVLAV